MSTLRQSEFSPNTHMPAMREPLERITAQANCKDLAMVESAGPMLRRYPVALRALRRPTRCRLTYARPVALCASARVPSPRSWRLRGAEGRWSRIGLGGS